MWNNFFFIGFPYIALVLFFGGTIYRGLGGFKGALRGKWNWSARGDFQWTTRSTGFFGRASIGPAALSLHFGILILFVAHLVGYVGGVFNLSSWVDFFRWAGMFAGILFLYGVAWALGRRIVIPQLRAMSIAEDYIVLILLMIIAGLGLYQSSVKLIFGVSYSVGPWLASIFKLQPDASLIAGAPLINKLHIISALIFFGYLPFTKLVHLCSYPFRYIHRPYISVRSYAGLKK